VFPPIEGALFASLLFLLLLVIIVVCWFCWCRRLLKVLLTPKDLGTTRDTFCVAWHVPGAIYRFAVSLPHSVSLSPFIPFSLAPQSMRKFEAIYLLFAIAICRFLVSLYLPLCSHSCPSAPLCSPLFYGPASFGSASSSSAF